MSFSAESLEDQDQLVTFVAALQMRRQELPRGVKKLWATTLAESLGICLRGIRGDHKPYDTELEWITSESMRVGSFLWICQALDLDPGKVRKVVQGGQRIRLPESRGRVRT